MKVFVGENYEESVALVNLIFGLVKTERELFDS